MDAFVTRLPKPQSQLRSQIRPDSPEKERPSKRAKRQGSPDSDSDHSHDSHDSQNKTSPTKSIDNTESAETDLQNDGNSRPTDFESALPPAAEGKEAIEEYEAMKSSQATAEEDGATKNPQPRWVRGQSSIYVDAFNLALDTVLEEESHLFDEKESEVFKQWRELNYEAQYLYVVCKCHIINSTSHISQICSVISKKNSIMASS
jgi:Fanconi-associated nuclease 1